MKNKIYYLIIACLLFCLKAFAIDKYTQDPLYGEVHKIVFNNPEHCISCHLYDEDLYRAIENKSPTDSSPISIAQMSKGAKISTPKNDDYESDDEEEKSDGAFGWFFGKKKKKENKALSYYLSNSYKLSGFVNKEYISPHEFNKTITSSCMTPKNKNPQDPQCHVKEELGYSHAVDVSPRKRYPNMQVPAEIPLNWDTDTYEGIITCGSCHNPHLDWLSTVKSYDLQKPFKEINGRDHYKTNYLRIKDPVRGYYTLCKSCHGEGY